MQLGELNIFASPFGGCNSANPLKSDDWNKFNSQRCIYNKLLLKPASIRQAKVRSHPRNKHTSDFLRNLHFRIACLLSNLHTYPIKRETEEPSQKVCVLYLLWQLQAENFFCPLQLRSFWLDFLVRSFVRELESLHSILWCANLDSYTLLFIHQHFFQMYRYLQIFQGYYEDCKYTSRLFILWPCD